MAVEGEWAWPRCIGCGKKIEKKRPRDFRYGMDVCCRDCMDGVYRAGDNSYVIYWAVYNAAKQLEWFQKREAHDEPVQEYEWQALATRFAKAWAQLRDHFQMPPFPAGLELFLVEILNVRDKSGRR